MERLNTIIIDNYDSFTYNLWQYVEELHGNPRVFLNDKITIKEIGQMHPTHIIISPGPGTAEKVDDFGICKELILKLGPKIPILGVCLGHQGIVYAYGGTIEEAPKIVHGLSSVVQHNGSKLFSNLPEQFEAMRYHSLCASRNNFPRELRITAWTKDDNLIMGVEHFKYPTFGIQFHPESFGTPAGKQILNNFLKTTC